MEKLFLELENLETIYGKVTMYGLKITNGKFTGEKGIIFYVDEKLPLDKIPEKDVLPSVVEVEGEYYVTDVVARNLSSSNMNNCEQTTLDSCYNIGVSFTANGITYGNPNLLPQNQSNPNDIVLSPGIPIATPIGIYTGTLGFLAIDNATDAIVGITDLRVTGKNDWLNIDDNFKYSHNITRDARFNWHDDTENIVYWSPELYDNIEIGRVVKYTLNDTTTKTPTPPFGNVAMIALYSGTVSENSFMPIGGNNLIDQPPQFVTAEELANVVGRHVFYTGAKTGANGMGSYLSSNDNFICDVIVSAVSNRNFKLSYLDADCYLFTDTLDLGAPVYVSLNEQWEWNGVPFQGNHKILGTISENDGLGNTITNIAEKLNIRAWDGSTPKYINPSTVQIKYIKSIFPNNVTNKVDGKNYNALGLTTSGITDTIMAYFSIKLKKIVISGNTDFLGEVYCSAYLDNTIIDNTKYSGVTKTFNTPINIPTNFIEINTNIQRYVNSDYYFTSNPYATPRQTNGDLWLNLTTSAVTYIKLLHDDLSITPYSAFSNGLNNFKSLKKLDLNDNRLTNFSFTNWKHIPSGITNIDLSENYLNLNAITNILKELNDVPAWQSPGVIDLSNQNPSVYITQSDQAYQLWQSLTGKGWTVNLNVLSPKTYYVSSQGNDANNGLSDTRPWKSLEKVALAITSGIIDAGDKILFKRGEIFSAVTSNEYVIDINRDINESNSGIPNFPITFSSYGSNTAKPILMTNKNNSLFRLVNVEYYNFENLNFTDLSFNPNDKINIATFNTAIKLSIDDKYYYKSNYCNIINCDFSNMSHAITSVGNYNLISGCTISNLKAGTTINATGIRISGSYNNVLKNKISGCWSASQAKGYDGTAIHIVPSIYSYELVSSPFVYTYETIKNNYYYNTINDNAIAFKLLQENEPTNPYYKAQNWDRICFNLISNCGTLVYFNNKYRYTSRNSGDFLFINNNFISNRINRFSGPNYGNGINGYTNVWQIWSGTSMPIMNVYSSTTNYAVWFNKNIITYNSTQQQLSGNWSFINPNYINAYITSNNPYIFRNTTNPDPIFWDYNLVNGVVEQNYPGTSFAFMHCGDFYGNSSCSDPSINIGMVNNKP